MYGVGDWLSGRTSDWSPWLCRSTTEASLIWGLLMEDSCQGSSIHVYVFLHRNVGVNSGRSDQLALAESGLLTLDPCWVVLPIKPSGLSWSWCSILSSGSAKHTATFTPQLPLSVSLDISSFLALTSLALDQSVRHHHTAEAEHVSVVFKVSFSTVIIFSHSVTAVTDQSVLPLTECFSLSLLLFFLINY